MKKKSLVVLALVTMVAAAFAVPAIAGGAKTIKVGDDYFVKKGTPSTVTVKAGTVLTFKWAGHAPHDILVTKGPKRFSSGNAKTKGTYKVKVTKRGTYKIICTIHQPDMRMTLKVK